MSSKLLAGRYELIEKIGEGGMAVVYKAKCRLLNRYVAIKILRPEYTKDKDFLDNFKRESQAAAGLQHPNIISVYDVGKEGDINYIVMELVTGKPLSDIIEEDAPLDYKVAIDITKQVASALSLAHKHNIVHRDIKPHNIMITKDGIAKLGDFGIARATSNTTIASDSKKIMGSVHYFSPEQARGTYVDARSDIYSLGIVLYEMLTSQVPFDGETPVEVALKHMNEQVIPPSNIVSSIPPALEKLVLKAMDKFQSNRYKTADELIEDLENIEFVTKVVGPGVFTNTNPAKVIMEEEVEASKELSDLVGETKKSKVNRKKVSKKKKVIIGIVSLLVVVAIGLGIAFAKGAFSKGKNQVTVPDLSSMSYSEAQSTLKAVDLKIKKGDEVPSDDIGKGKIVSQLPLKGTKLDKGKTVTVNISAGKKEGLIPSLINKKYVDRDSIEEILQQYGYKLGNVNEKESDVEKGLIIEQSPEAGQTAKKGTTVDITVSKGKEKPKVPSLTGLSVDEAKKAIINAGFTVGSTSYGESDIYKAGYVMEQEYPAGTELPKGEAISIVVAKEQEKTPKPQTNTDGHGDNKVNKEQEEPSHNNGEKQN